jgi:hypothetical protein
MLYFPDEPDKIITHKERAHRDIFAKFG